MNESTRPRQHLEDDEDDSSDEDTISVLSDDLMDRDYIPEEDEDEEKKENESDVLQVPTVLDKSISVDDEEVDIQTNSLF